MWDSPELGSWVHEEPKVASCLDQEKSEDFSAQRIAKLSNSLASRITFWRVLKNFVLDMLKELPHVKNFCFEHCQECKIKHS